MLLLSNFFFNSSSFTSDFFIEKSRPVFFKISARILEADAKIIGTEGVIDTIPIIFSTFFYNRKY